MRPYQRAFTGGRDRSHPLLAQFKVTATRRINGLRDTAGTPVWQRNFYEHVVRDEEDFSRIRAYIEANPRRWAEDEYNPSRI